MNLTEAMLQVQTAPRALSALREAPTTVEVKGNAAVVEFPKKQDEAVESSAWRLLEARGESFADWTVTGFRTSEWTMANGETGESVRYTFARRGTDGAAPYPIDEVVAWLDSRTPSRGTITMGTFVDNDPDPAFLFLMGDTQFGKIDGDGTDGTLKRCLRYIDTGAEMLRAYSETWPIGEVVIGFMGDHGEGFVSQGGANIYRTRLTNTEQQRLTRRVMAYAAEAFASAMSPDMPLRMVAVPGNHGDTMRVNGRGATKYNDSYDTEALVSLADAFAMSNRPELQRIETYVPHDDEIVVVLDIAGTRTVFSHGHFHAPGKHFDWLRGQAFNKQSPMRDCELLVEGHLHHHMCDNNSGVTFIGVPAVESESTWFRHRTGIAGDPGALVVLTCNGDTYRQEMIR